MHVCSLIKVLHIPVCVCWTLPRTQESKRGLKEIRILGGSLLQGCRKGDRCEFVHERH